MVRIDEARFLPVEVPLDKPVRASKRTFGSRQYLLLTLKMNDGSTGIGFSYVGTEGAAACAKLGMDVAGPLLANRNPSDRSGVFSTLTEKCSNFGRSGIWMNLVSAIDIALWDWAGRDRGEPLHKLLGAPGKKSVPAYASGGYYGDDKGVEDLRDEFHAYKAAGFRAFKMKTGVLSVREEATRIDAVRDVIGDDAPLMLDAYSMWEDGQEAVPYIKMFEEYRPYWIEDPFLPQDLIGMRALADQTSVPLATGEFHSMHWEFEQLAAIGGIKILQPEAPRCGGITEFVRIADMAAEKKVLISPCWLHHIHAHVVAAVANALFAEVFPNRAILNFGALIDEEPEVAGGECILPKRPGLGFDFVPDVARFRL